MKNDNRREQLGQPMKKENSQKSGNTLWLLFFTGLVCLFLVMGLLCYSFVGMKKELQKNSRAAQKKENEISETISQMKQDIQSLNEKVLAQEQELADYKKNAQVQGETAENSQKETTEENAMIGPPARPALSADQLQPGQIIDISQIQGSENTFFQEYEILEGDSVYNRIYGKSYYENENIGLQDLRYLKMLHYNFNHEIQVGEMIVNAAISRDVLSVFQELFAAEYEIQSMRLIDDYWTGDGDSSDSNSIDNNNTSAFCYRQITGGGNLSNHAYGRAIDINPQQNPYVWSSQGQLQWSHENASPYVDRACGDPHVIVENDVCYNIFAKYGFSWGGLWSNPVDYQHFEKES